MDEDKVEVEEKVRRWKGGGDLLVRVPEEGGEAGEHDVGDHPDAPQVRVQRQRLVVDNLNKNT